MNPLFKEEVEATLNGNLDGIVDERLSPRKSISSGYESRCNSSSDSSSCTECEEKRVKKSAASVKRESRLSKQNKSEKKKKKEEFKKWESESNKKPSEELQSNQSNLKRRTARLKNVYPTGPFNLSPIPEGRIDCSIPPPIWPRFEESLANNRENYSVGIEVPARIYHNGSTNPVNFMFKYNERYPKCCYERTRLFSNYFDRKAHIYNSLSLKTEYENNWIECSKVQVKESNSFQSVEGNGKSSNDGGTGFPSEGSVDKLFVDRNELTQEVLRDLANLIAYAMTKKNSLPLDSFLKSLADSIQKSLEILSQTDNEDDLQIFCDNLDRNKYLSKMFAALLSRNGIDKIPFSRTGDENDKSGVDTNELTQELEKLSRKTINSNEELTSYKLNNIKDEIYSCGSEGKHSSSSSSGCKDLYMSSNSSSSAGKDNVFSASSFESVRERDKPYQKNDKSSEESDEKKSDEKREEESLLNLIHHQRDFSSSSAESAFGSSDISPPSSDSSSAKGVLNPVFLHENIYSVPKSVRNAIICESYKRTKNEDCGSIRNCGSSAFEKLISAKRKTSHDSQMEELGPLAYSDEGKTRLSTVVATAKVDKTVLKKVEHPYYVS